LLNMMDDFILTISAEATHYKLKEELLDNILNDAVEQVSDLAAAKGIRIQDDAPASSLFIMANTRLLVRAMVNLLFNAIKFSPPNSRLVIYTRHLQVEQKAQISISNPVQSGDTQVDLIPSMPGFGLGLDFVDIVIRKHQGRIDRRIPQEGVAHVCIELPCFEHGE
jgi:signal transduction histidine kinase